MGQKHETFREFRKPFPPRDIRKNPPSMYARVPQVMAQFVLKIELLSHIMGTTPILEMARAYGLRPRLWLLIKFKASLLAIHWTYQTLNEGINVSVVILPIEKYKLLNQVSSIQHSVVADVKFFVICFRRKRME